MSENTNAGRAHDPVRDKYVHAVSWDYTSRDPQVARLRERLAAEYDGRPATPAGMDAGRFIDSSRLAVRTLFERMASHGLLAGPDGLYAAMFPFPRHAVHRRPDRHGRPVRRIAGDRGRGRPASRIGCGRDVRHGKGADHGFRREEGVLGGATVLGVRASGHGRRLPVAGARSAGRIGGVGGRMAVLGVPAHRHVPRRRAGLRLVRV